MRFGPSRAMAWAWAVLAMTLASRMGMIALVMMASASCFLRSSKRFPGFGFQDAASVNVAGRQLIARED